MSEIEHLQKIFKDIDRIDGESKAWKRMFDLQTKLNVGLELEKMRLEKEIERLKEENNTLQGYLNNVHNNLKVMTKEDNKQSLPVEWVDENL